MTLSDIEIEETLTQLLSLPKESEIVEFKEAKTQFGVEDIGEYFSAIANEANLAKKTCGWLVFGVREQRNANTPWVVVGTQFRISRPHLDSLKKK